MDETEDQRPRAVAKSEQDDLPTRVEAPAQRLSQAVTSGPTRSDPSSLSASLASDGRSRTGQGTSLSTATLHDTLHLQDVDRTRAFLRIAAIVALSLIVPLPWLGGDRIVKIAFAITLVGIVLACTVLRQLLLDPMRYRTLPVSIVSTVCVAGALGGIAFFGPFSPAAVVVPFGLYFFGMSRSLGGTLIVYLSCALGYLALALPVAAGWLDDRGLMRSQRVGSLDAAVVITSVEVMFAATYLIARLSRRATELALDQHDRAVRALAGRDALLAEARLDLEGLLRARGLGRFSNEIIGRYRLGEVIGRGGMGEVYEAAHLDTEEKAAVKLLHPHLLAEPASELRFLRESEIAKTLQVSNVVRVLATSERGAPIPYIVMERLQGRDLSDLLRAQGKMRMSDVLRMLREIGCGLDAARAAGIVHRDIKPRNLFLADKPDGKTIWKILDFGVSKLANEATLTGGNLVGTPSYMAPEQASGGELSHRTDLFALGVIAYRALTGRPAFSGEEMASILFEVLTAMPPRPSDSARLHEDVDRVLAIALAKDPWERFDSGAELADALDKGSRGRLPDALRARADRLLQEHPWG